MPVGFKVVLDHAPAFSSPFVRLREHTRHFFLNQPTESRDSPCFFLADAATPYIVACHVPIGVAVALLRVVADDVRTVERVPGVESVAGYAAFWRGEMPGNHPTLPGTLAAGVLTPLAVAWRGTRWNDEASLIAELAAAMEAARGTDAPVEAEPSIWLPVIRA